MIDFTYHPGFVFFNIVFYHLLSYHSMSMNHIAQLLIAKAHFNKRSDLGDLRQHLAKSEWRFTKRCKLVRKIVEFQLWP